VTPYISLRLIKKKVLYSELYCRFYSINWVESETGLAETWNMLNWNWLMANTIKWRVQWSVLNLQYITLLLLSCGGLIRFVQISCSPLHTVPVSHCTKVTRELSCRPCDDQRKTNATYRSIIRNQNYLNRAQHAMNMDALFGPCKTHTAEGQYSNRIWHKYDGRLWTWMFWFVIGTTGRLLRRRILGFHKMRAIFDYQKTY